MPGLRDFPSRCSAGGEVMAMTMAMATSSPVGTEHSCGDAAMESGSAPAV